MMTAPDPTIEIRFVKFGHNLRSPHLQLEYRSLVLCIDASGSLCEPSYWSRWRIVQTIEAKDAAYEDVRASGGIMRAL